MPEPIKTKTCRICKQTKSLSEFYKNKHCKDGYFNNCKTCYLKSIKEYSQTEKGKAVNRKACLRYKKTEKSKVRDKRYRQSHKGKEAQRRYDRSEKGKVAKKRYQQSKKGKIARNNAKKLYNIRHSERVKAKDAVNDAIKADKLPQANSLQCNYCPEQAKQYHHHKGYKKEHWLDVVPVCIKCHSHYTSPIIAGSSKK